jgi:hypothetical protein
MSQSPYPQPYQPPKLPKPRRKAARIALIFVGSIVGMFVVLAVIGAIIGPPKTDNAASQTIVVTKSAGPSAALTAAATSTKHAPTTAKPARTKAKPAAAPSPTGCNLPDNQDLIERDDDPGAQILAAEIGEVDLENCVTTLSEFQQTAGQGAGECTTIAWASDNPGYDVNKIPAAPLKDVIESAGPGC